MPILDYEADRDAGAIWYRALSWRIPIVAGCTSVAAGVFSTAALKVAQYRAGKTNLNGLSETDIYQFWIGAPGYVSSAVLLALLVASIGRFYRHRGKQRDQLLLDLLSCALAWYGMMFVVASTSFSAFD